MGVNPASRNYETFAANRLVFDVLVEPWDEIADRDSFLRHAVAIAHGDGPVFERLEVRSNAIRGADLVLASVAAPN